MADFTLDDFWHGIPFNHSGTDTWNLDWIWHGKPFVADGPASAVAPVAVQPLIWIQA